MLFFRRKSKKQKVIDKKELDSTIQQELAPYITREELNAHLTKIEKDKKRKKLWNSLSKQKKEKLRRYLAGKKGE